MLQKLRCKHTSICATLVVGAVCVRTDPPSIKTQRVNLTKFHCSSLLENNGSQTNLSKSGSIHFGSFRNDSYIKGYVAKTTLQKHHLICNACKAIRKKCQCNIACFLHGPLRFAKTSKFATCNFCQTLRCKLLRATRVQKPRKMCKPFLRHPYASTQTSFLVKCSANDRCASACM